jgi:hypothetical protein
VTLNDGRRDARGRLPVRPEASPLFPCRRERGGYACQAWDRHPPPCRHYRDGDEPGGAGPVFREWWAGPGRWERDPRPGRLALLDP